MTALRVRDQMERDLRLRGLSPHTVEAYLTAAECFCRHCGKPPARLGEADVRDYLVHRLGRVSRSTVCVNLASLKFLYTVTLKRPEVVADIPYPKRAPQRLPAVLSGSEVARVLEAVSPDNQRMIAGLLYGLGLRVSEALLLRPAHIDGARGVLHVLLGKGRRDRDLPLHSKLLQELRAYWRRARLPRDGYLFPSADPARPLTADSCQHALRRAARKAGLRKRVSPHTLRHCYATHTLQLGGSLAAIQKLLGHASILTTMRYLRLQPEHLARVKNPYELLGATEASVLG